MTIRAGYRVEGLASVTRALRAVGVDVSDLKDAFQAIATRGAALVKRHTPVRSGRLQGDIRGNRATSRAVVTAGRSNLRYAGPINYGWPKRGIAAAGFMQAGDKELQPYAVQQLEDEINQSIRKRGLKQ
jgi:hypothetical protein